VREREGKEKKEGTVIRIRAQWTGVERGAQGANTKTEERRKRRQKRRERGGRERERERERERVAQRTNQGRTVTSR